MNSARDFGGRARPWVAAVAATAAGFAAGLAPFVTVAAVAGSALFLVAGLYPLVVVGITLVTGPIDLGFLTGGFKTLAPQFGGLDMNGIRLVVVVASLGLLLAIAGRRTIRVLVERPFRWYVLFVGFAGVTLLYSTAPADGARLFVKLAYPLIIALVVILVARREDTREVLMNVTLASMVMSLCVITPLVATAGGYEVDVMTNKVRYRGPGLHQNPFAFYCTVVVLLCIARLQTRRQLRYLLLAAVAFTWIVLTRTRIALAGLAAGLIVLEWYFFRRRHQVLLPVTAIGIAALLVGFTLPAFIERTFLGAPPPLWDLLTTTPTAWVESVNLSGRDFLWALAWQLFAREPLTGSGLGATSAFLRAHSTPEGLVVHNEYLRVAAETGLIGLGLFGLAFWRMFRAPFRAPRAESPFVDECRAAAVASIAVFAVVSITDNPLDYYAPVMQYVAFFLACGVGSSTGALRGRRSVGVDPDQPEPAPG